MIHVLLRRRIQEAQWLLLPSAAAVWAFCWFRVWLVSRLDTSRFKEILDLLPSDWQRFMSVDFAWLITYPGRISLAYDELIVVGCVSIWAIARGSDCVSGELGRGTLEMLLAQPVNRLTVLGTQALVTIVGLAVLAGSAWLGTWCGIQATAVKQKVTPAWHLPVPLPGFGSDVPIPFAEPETQRIPMRDLVEAKLFVAPSVGLFALGLMMAGFTTCMSAWDRYRWRTIGLVVAVYLAQGVLKLAGMSTPDLAWMKWLSAFTPYEPEGFVRVADQTPEYVWRLAVYSPDGVWLDHGPLAYCLLMGSLGVGFYFVGTIIFCRRDLPAPL